MSETLITGAVVLIAVILGGLIVQIVRKFTGDGQTQELRALRDEKARLQAELAALSADFKNASGQLEVVTETAREQVRTIETVTSHRNELKIEIGKAEEAVRSRDALLKQLREDNEQMNLQFKKIAAEILKDHGETFKKQNHEQIGQLLTPLKTKIEEFEKGVDTSHKESVQQHAALKEQIRLLSAQSAEMSKETQNLTRALKGKVQTQGAWGEMILETILQRSGLREGAEYTRQESHAGEDGRRLRTDVIVNLPNGERIVIDAKVSLKDFEGFVNADEDGERAARLAGHTASVKAHIKTLSGKEYHASTGGKLDFVIMFVPIEAALGAALQQDGEIGFFAADNKVAIATPTTLTIALKTVAAIWRVERQNQNAAEIAQRAGKLYDKFVGFVSDLSEVGDRLHQAEAAYDGAMKKLSTGRGNLVGQVEKLKTMGAETNKKLPADLLEEETPRLVSQTGA